MDSSRLTQLSGTELAKLIASKELSPVEVTEAYLERIDALDSRLNAYITVCREEALAAARKAEEAVVRGDKLGPLHGLPLGVKDQFETRGVLTTSGSRSLGDNVPKTDATVVARAKGAGAILIGKTTMTQFASGLGDHWQYGDPPRNPWDLERDTIGSSNGSAIGIAASMCAISLGEDTGGSIRCPASATGVVGLRPTWGRVSRHGMHGLSWSMDTGGPITRTVEDAALMMNAIAGYDPQDSLTSKLPVPDYTRSLSTDLRGVRVGLLRELTDPEFTNEEVVQAVSDAAKQLEGLGATVEETSLPLLREVGAVAGPVTGSDSAYVHRNGLRNRPEDYGRNLRLRLTVSSLIPGHVLQKAMRARALVRREWLKLFQRFDVLLSPTLMFTLGKIEYVEPITTREQAQRRFGKGTGDATITAPFVGTPAMTVPCGFDSNGVPIGLQIMGSHFQEEKVLKVGHAYESSTPWHSRRPAL
ncbi:MAG: amidase [Chloroflexi bacterium]|nr:amidase [Chloroflexota bacterium]